MSGHNGRVWAENNGQSGSIFYCELPQWNGPPHVEAADDEQLLNLAEQFLKQLA
jgi:hypothetical protein